MSFITLRDHTEKVPASNGEVPLECDSLWPMRLASAAVREGEGVSLFQKNNDQERVKFLALIINRVETKLDHLLFDAAHIRRMNGNPLTKVMGVSPQTAAQQGECVIAWIPYTESTSQQASRQENWLAVAQFSHDGQRWNAQVKHAKGEFTDSE